MVKIRLTKIGRHKNPFYRIVTTDSRNKRDGAYLELLGTYEPFEGKIKINEELTLKVLSLGAQPTETVLSMLKTQGIWAKYLATKTTKKPKAKTKKVTKVEKTEKPAKSTKAKTKKVAKEIEAKE